MKRIRSNSKLVNQELKQDIVRDVWDIEQITRDMTDYNLLTIMDCQSMVVTEFTDIIISIKYLMKLRIRHSKTETFF